MIVLLALAGGVGADLRVVDDSGRTVALDTPARRIVALAPHAAELVHAAGAGDRLVGASASMTLGYQYIDSNAEGGIDYQSNLVRATYLQQF